MLVAIEGLDCSGKTTLFEAMRKEYPHAVHVPSLVLPDCLHPHMQAVELRQVHLWQHLYDPEKLYICDRCPWVSGPVYDLFFGRPKTVLPWQPDELYVLFLMESLDTVKDRMRKRGDRFVDAAGLNRLLNCYEQVLRGIEHRTVFAADAARQLIQRWRYGCE